MLCEVLILNENKERKRSAREEIQKEDAKTILNAEKGDYLDYIVDEYRYKDANFNLDKVQIDVESFSANADVTLIIPVSGNLEVLEYEPQRSLMKDYTADVEPVSGEGKVYELHIDLPKPGRRRDWTEERIEREVESVKEYIETDWGRLQGDIEEFNDQLRSHAEQEFEKRREEAREKRELFGQVDYPLRHRSDTPDTFSIETPERREMIQKPEPEGDTALDPVPTVPEETYNEILEAVNDIGRGFERSPHLFNEYGEEDLRDFIRVFLEMNFESGTATGETFNKEGKTDILLRTDDGTNVFVAECAVWDGEKYFKSKIDQLFGYLTWRDSKAAVVLFVDRKDMESVREKIEGGAEEHETISELVERQNESWWQYRAHFPDDPDREVDLAVLAFHIPSE
jgi:hypothetical protein